MIMKESGNGFMTRNLYRKSGYDNRIKTKVTRKVITNVCTIMKE